MTSPKTDVPSTVEEVVVVLTPPAAAEHPRSTGGGRARPSLTFVGG